MVKIFIDPGHGGADPGASGNGLQEKDLTLDISLRIRDGLKAYENVEVQMSRTSDTFPSLNDRTNQANAWGADYLLSVHINAAAANSARGYQDHIYTNVDSKTKSYQNVMHEEVYNFAYRGLSPDRGKEQTNLHMVRESRMTAILTENLFITNPADAKLLADPSFRQKIAQGHVNGFVKFLGLKSAARPPSAPTGKLWKVQTGAFSERANADKMVAVLKNEGYRPFVIHVDNLYKVQVGAFDDKKNAEALVSDLERNGYKPFLNYE